MSSNVDQSEAFRQRLNEEMTKVINTPISQLRRIAKAKRKAQQFLKQQSLNKPTNRK
jgi:hypothetical protein